MNNITLIDAAIALNYNDMMDMYENFLMQTESIPENEEITISAGILKNLIQSYMAYVSMMNNDLDRVSDYLQSKNLI